MAKLHTFNDYTRLVIFFYRTIGEDLYEHNDTSNKRRRAMRIYFYLSYFHMFFMMWAESIFIVEKLKSRDTLMEAFAAAPCIGMAVVAAIKHGTICMNKRALCDHLDELEAICPKSKRQQQAYNLPQYERHVQPFLLGLLVGLLGYVGFFGLYPVCEAAVKYHLLGAPNFERNLGFDTVYPYDATGSLVAYWLTFLSQTWVCYFGSVIYLMSDLLLVISITQLCMHFDYVSNNLESYVGDATRDDEDVDHLKTLIEHHNKSLALSEQFNSIFSTFLLLNFGAASLTICLGSFVLTVAATDNTFRYAFILLSGLIQVFVACYYGHYLMAASSRVGDGAYNSNWYDCSRRYTRMLHFMILRSRKPATLHGPFIPSISFTTFMSVIKVSYQFSALLRTTYKG